MASGQALFLAIGGGITAALFAELATRFPHEPASRAACGGIASGLLLGASASCCSRKATGRRSPWPLRGRSSRPSPGMHPDMETAILLAFAAALAVLGLSAALRVRESVAEGDVGHLAVDGVRALSCATGAIALVAIAIGRLG